MHAPSRSPEGAYGVEQVAVVAVVWGALSAVLLMLAAMRGSELSKSESRVDEMLERTRIRRQMKQSAAFYIQALSPSPPVFQNACAADSRLFFPFMLYFFRFLHPSLT